MGIYDRTKKAKVIQMAAPAIVVARRMKYTSGTHRHVGWVKLLDGTALTRDEVLAAMKRGVEFFTRAPNGQGARLAPFRCRTCLETFLRTDRDLSRADNLDELPLF